MQKKEQLHKPKQNLKTQAHSWFTSKYSKKYNTDVMVFNPFNKLLYRNKKEKT